MSQQTASELKRKTPLARKTELSRTSGPAGSSPVGDARLRDSSEVERRQSKTEVAGSNPARGAGANRRGSTLKQGRGFAASAAQREKVRGMACAACGDTADSWTAIDPAHICARGMGGCDDALCVIPLCRTAGGGCHYRFDHGELLIDLVAKLEPAFRAEVAHAVMHLGLEGTRVRLCPSLYRSVRAGEAEAA